MVLRVIYYESIIDGSDGLAGEILELDLAEALEGFSEAGSRTGWRIGAQREAEAGQRRLWNNDPNSKLFMRTRLNVASWRF